MTEQPQPEPSYSDERYAGQLAKARDRGLSEATVESVRQGCYSDADVQQLIADHGRRVEDGKRTLALQVEQARREGHSWAEIGEALGVSKQAAWQRFGGSS